MACDAPSDSWPCRRRQLQQERSGGAASGASSYASIGMIGLTPVSDFNGEDVRTSRRLAHEPNDASRALASVACRGIILSAGSGRVSPAEVGVRTYLFGPVRCNGTSWRLEER